MARWTPQELDRVGQAQELQLATLRRQGGLSQYVTMWVVRVDDNLYVRSAGGPNRPWYRRAEVPDGAFITGSDFLMDGGVTASYFFGELAPN